MSKYYCEDCGAFCDEDELVEVRDEEVGFHGVECPECGSDCVEECNTCESCDEGFVGHGSYCLDCMNTIREEALFVLQKHIGDDELEALLDYYGIDLEERIKTL